MARLFSAIFIGVMLAVILVVLSDLAAYAAWYWRLSA